MPVRAHSVLNVMSQAHAQCLKTQDHQWRRVELMYSKRFVITALRLNSSNTKWNTSNILDYFYLSSSNGFLRTQMNAPRTKGAEDKDNQDFK